MLAPSTEDIYIARRVGFWFAKPENYFTVCSVTVARLQRVQNTASRGSVVRTSVFGWRTFPDLCLIYG